MKTSYIKGLLQKLENSEPIFDILIFKVGKSKITYLVALNEILMGKRYLSESK